MLIPTHPALSGHRSGSPRALLAGRRTGSRRAFLPRRRAAVLVVVPLAALVLAGCSASGSAPAPSTSAPLTAAGSTAAPGPESPTVTETPASPSASAEPAPSTTVDISGSGVQPSATGSVTGSGAPAGQGAAVVHAIRVADHGSFDRVVIEFQGTFGAWNVGYVNQVISDPEGKQVALAGSAFVSVRVQKATFDNQFQVGEGIPHVTYTGPRRITARLPNVQEVADAGDFEAVIGLGVGVSHASGLRAYRLDGPSRLVIDIAH